MEAIILNEDQLDQYLEQLEDAAGCGCPDCACMDDLYENRTDGECSADSEIIALLETALADEWLAAYQYWTCKNLARGEGRADSVDEFDQHFKEELEHADKIMLRLNELGGRPISDPSCWKASANPWTAVETSDVCRQLDITRKAEEDAIAYYTECIRKCRDAGDEVTKRLFQQILAEECEHKYDLEMLIGEHCKD